MAAPSFPLFALGCANQWGLETVFRLRMWHLTLFGQDLDVHMILLERQLNRLATLYLALPQHLNTSEEMVWKCPTT